MTPSQIGYNDASAKQLAATYAYDVEGAKALLAEAGWSDTNGDGIVIVIAVLTVISNTIGDLLTGWLDPRIRNELRGPAA